jgi:hypothetical protein
LILLVCYEVLWNIGGDLMTVARKTIYLNRTEGVYHCISRCVRRAFLCGVDGYSGRSYDHRKSWIKDRLKELSEIFAVDVCGYSVMSNHLHIVLRNRPDLWQKWDDADVASRWLKLFPRKIKSVAVEGEGIVELSAEEQLIADKERLFVLRERLGDISWFMRCLNESIARKANKEDKCSGRFWEGQFKCIALLDEAAELACMAYVDLNPVRAKIVDSPEESDFTSVKDRIDTKVSKEKIKKLKQRHIQMKKNGKKLTRRQEKIIEEEKKKSELDKWLNPIGITHYKSKDRRKGFLSIKLNEYLELIDWTGRAIKSGKRGSIPNHLKPILTRLNVDVDNWINTVLSFGSLFYRVVGTIESIVEKAKQAGQNFFKGKSSSLLAFNNPD